MAHATADHCDLLNKSSVPHLGATLLGAPATATTFGRSTALDEFIDNASDARALVVQLAIILAGYENASDREHWRTLNSRTGHYLTYLETLGYTLSDIEARACGRTPATVDDILTDTTDQGDTQEQEPQEIEQSQEIEQLKAA